jgi:curved DNA-binding protein CbpA
MDASKDYCATLGLTPSADAVVIRAAYKALAQRYHPDKSGADRKQASARMAEINEAYGVLSDDAKRAEYDKLREKDDRNADTAFADADTEPTASSPLDKDWQIATQFYPELETIRARLAKISWKLAEAFRARVLKNKEFADAPTIAGELENEFLSLYFGASSTILAFARALIMDGHRDAARDLNRAIKVLGDGGDPEKMMRVIREKYDISAPKRPWCYDSSGERRGISAQRYARDHGHILEEVIRSIRRGELPGFVAGGVFYVEIDQDGNPLPWRVKSGAGVIFLLAISVAFVFLVLAGALFRRGA